MKPDLIRRSASRLVGGIFVAVVASACGSASGGSPAAPALASPAAASGSAIEIPAGFPIGSWTVTITDDDLTAADVTNPGLVTENTGVFTTTFAADGTWTTVQETDAPVRWPVFRGTFTPVGTDAMDQVTTFPPDFAGDVVRFTWRLEDGQLHLTVPEPPDEFLPIVIETHPWEPTS